MTRRIAVLIVCLLAAGASVLAQNKIVIPAGTPEDKALSSISNESDQQKRISMLQDFVQTYSSNPAAVAYGNWQLSQQYSVSDPAKALEFGDKALAAMPDVLEILQSQTDLAQQLKLYSKVVDYAARAAIVIHEIITQPKPTDVSDDVFAMQVAQRKESLKPIYDYVAAAGYNAMVAESDPQKRLSEIERYTEAFKGSTLAQQATVLGVATLQEANDTTRLYAYGERALAGNANNLQLLTLMANAYAEDPKGNNLTKAETYSRKAIELAKSDKNDANATLTEGFAHQILGYALMRQEKTPAAISELKTAAPLVKNDPVKYSIVMYRLGFAYAKTKQMEAAKQTLTEAANVQGPFQSAAKDLLAKVTAARKAAAK